MPGLSQYHPNRLLYDPLAVQKQKLSSRRRFLKQVAGGSIALLFGAPVAGSQTFQDPFIVLDSVLQHLLPSEADIPGAREIRALEYLRFVTGDPKVDKSDRELILKGVTWLESLSVKLEDSSFVDLDDTRKERILRRMARNMAGELWITTLLIYLLEALLAAPAYGSNPDGIGWKWLGHTPGFPLPGPETIYPRLKL